MLQKHILLGAEEGVPGEGGKRKVLKGTLGGWWLNAQADLYVRVECRKAN